MKLRAYSIVNQYIAGIHAGIQTAHAIHEMFIKYPKAKDKASNFLWDWAVKDKTIIVLNGGYQQNMFKLIKLMEDVDTLPNSYFCEEEEALNGALTAAAIVLPEYMYAPQYDHWNPENIADVWQDHSEAGCITHVYTEEEKILITEIKKLRLKGE